MLRYAIAAIVALLLSTGLARAQQPSCREDDALSRAAALLLELGAPFEAEAIEQAVAASGSDALASRARAFDIDAARRAEQWIDRQRVWAEGIPRCGQALDEDKRLVIVARAGGRLIVGSEGALHAKLDAGFAAPEIVVLGADGELIRRALEPAERDGAIRLPRNLDGPLLVQLLARGPRGIRPVAARTIAAPAGDASRTPPSQGLQIRLHARQRVAGPATETQNASLQARVADLRRRYDALPLRSNALLSTEAKEQAAAICASGDVSHERDGADPEKRLARRGLRARVVGEAVAKARSAAEAYAALEASPSHRMALVDPRFTDGGFAELSANGRVCAVVLLAAWPRAIAASR